MKNDKQLADWFYGAKLTTPFGKICNHFSVFKANFPQCLNPHFVFVGYFTRDLKY